MIEIDTHAKKATKVVTVTFAASARDPYHATETGTTTVGVVLAAVKAHFSVSDDAQFSYVLAFDGQEVASEATLDEVAIEAHRVKFTLVKRITQG